MIARRARPRVGVMIEVPAAALADRIRDGGMHPEGRATKIHRACETALEVGLDELRRLVREDPPRAKRVLERFPGFGDPGAERVLLFNGRLRGLAPDSNILRVLLRTGFGEDKGAYAKTWRAVNAAKDLIKDGGGAAKAVKEIVKGGGAKQAVDEIVKGGDPKKVIDQLTGGGDDNPVGGLLKGLFKN